MVYVVAWLNRCRRIALRLNSFLSCGALKPVHIPVLSWRMSELEIPYIYHNVAKERWQIKVGKTAFKTGKYEPYRG